MLKPPPEGFEPVLDANTLKPRFTRSDIALMRLNGVAAKRRWVVPDEGRTQGVYETLNVLVHCEDERIKLEAVKVLLAMDRHDAIEDQEAASKPTGSMRDLQAARGNYLDPDDGTGRDPGVVQPAEQPDQCRQ